VTVLSWLDRVRADRDRRRAAILVGAGVGLAVAQLHWAGLLLGGVLVGLASRDLPRALLSGLAFGVGALVVFLGGLAIAGTLSPALAMGQLTSLAVGLPIAAGLVGSLARGVV